MKSSTPHSFPHRRALVAAGLTVLLGTATAVAQSGGAGSTNYGTGTTRSSDGTTSTTGTRASEDARRDTQTSSSSSTSTTGDYSRSTDKSTTASPTITSDASTTGGATTMTGRDNKLGWMERRFVTKAADSGKAELELAQLAAQQASNAEVKAYAQKLIEDHGKVNQELTSLAGQKNVKLDDDEDGKDRHYRRLSKKTGTEFDQEFVEHMIEMHEDDVKRFEKASTDAKDQDLKSFAAKHIEHLRGHLQEAQSLRSTIMPTGRMDDRSGRSTTTTGATSDATSTTTDTTTSDQRANTSTGSATTSPSTPSSSDTKRPDSSR